MTMEHIYTIKVKRHFDPRGLYPSERRYSASTVFGLAWLHLALAATAFLLACLALVNPTPTSVLTKNNDLNFPSEFLLNEIRHDEQLRELDNYNDTEEVIYNGNLSKNASPEILNQLKEDVNELENEKEVKNIENEEGIKYPITLVLAPTLLAVGGLAAGLAAILASRKWYVDQNITWFFLSSVLSTIFSVIALCMIITWIVSASENGLSFCDYFSDGNLFGKIKVVRNIDGEFSKESMNETSNNNTWYYIIKVPVNELRDKKIPLLGEETKQSKTRKVLSINILIACAVEIIWSILSLRIAWRGMKADYPEDESVENRRGGTVHVVTEIKGNNTKHLPKNTKILPPQPDLIEHYPKDNKIKKFFQLQQENGGFFLKANQHENGFMVIGPEDTKASDLPRRENSAEYKERILNFLNRCSTEQSNASEVESPVSIADDVNSNPNPTTGDFHADRSFASVTVENPEKVVTDRLSLASWGDANDYTIYNQNTLDFNKIMLNFDRRKENNQKIDKEEDLSLEDAIQNEQTETVEIDPETPLNDPKEENASS